GKIVLRRKATADAGQALNTLNAKTSHDIKLKTLHNMKVKALLVLTFLLIFVKISIAQSLIGNWKGTSLCQVKNSPCHDEIVVYHITSSGINSYQVNAGKIIDGKEDDMRTSHFSFDPKQKILFLLDKVHQVKWEFKVSGEKMH